MFRVRNRTIRGLLVALACGLALSVVVALTCTLLAQLGAGPVSPMTPEDAVSLSERLHLGQGLYHRMIGEAEAFGRDGETGARLMRGATGRLDRFGYREYRLTIAALAFASGKDLGMPGPWGISEIEAGWPYRCFRRAVAVQVDVDALFAKTPAVVSLDSDRIIIPLRPFWGKLALNTLFYAGVVWLLFFAPAIVRRARRVRQGLCPHCAYPVGVSERCSECGAILKTA